MVAKHIAEKFNLPTVKDKLHLAKRFVQYLVRDFLSTGCTRSAAALTYMSLFALVPTLTVVFSVFSVVPAFEGVDQLLSDFIFNNFLPETGEEIQAHLTRFAEQARSLTGWGVGILLLTAYLMLTNIEKTFNDIWGVEHQRGGLSSFLLYWAVLSIGPILLGAGLVMSGYLLSLQLAVESYDTLGIGAALLHLLPWLTTWLAMTLLFVAVPNCRVPLRYGVIGGAITALCFEILKNLFGVVMAKSSYQSIYGAFAAVPLFLLWINSVWMVILAGAILVRTLAERHYVVVEGKSADMVSALKVLSLFHSAAQRGGKVSDKDCYRVGLGVVSWQYLRGRLLAHKWIAITASGDYVLARDLRTLTLWDLALLVHLRIEDLIAKIANPTRAHWFEDFIDKREHMAAYAKDVFGVSVEEFLHPKSLKYDHTDRSHLGPIEPQEEPEP